MGFWGWLFAASAADTLMENDQQIQEQNESLSQRMTQLEERIQDLADEVASLRRRLE